MAKSQSPLSLSTRRSICQAITGGALITSTAASQHLQNGEEHVRRDEPLALVPTPNGSIRGPYLEFNSTYIIQSRNQAYPCSVRVLLPDRLEEMREPRVVYVLPVNPDTRVQWNDGLMTFRSLNLHNRYNVIAVAPSFSDWPWFADHPTRANVRQESFFMQDVVPFVNNLMAWLPMLQSVGFSPAAPVARLLLGFSKSGNGSYQLLLRYPDTFKAASIWDAPVMKTAPDQFEMPTIYVTQENFDGYSIPKLLAERASLLSTTPARLALFGYSLFGGPAPIVDPTVGAPVDHLKKAHDLMDSLKIPHLYESSRSREHRWDSGWMEEAMAALDTMART